MFKITTRDWLWMTALVAVSVSWFSDQRQVREALRAARSAAESWESYARELQSEEEARRTRSEWYRIRP